MIRSACLTHTVRRLNEGPQRLLELAVLDLWHGPEPTTSLGECEELGDTTEPRSPGGRRSRPHLGHAEAGVHGQLVDERRADHHLDGRAMIFFDSSCSADGLMSSSAPFR
jgi:hypothetical protein